MKLECDVLLSRINGKSIAKNCGEGKCSLDASGFGFSGNCAGEVLDFFIPASSLEALPFSAGEEFECYYKGVLYYFYPKQNPSLCAMWSQYADTVHRLATNKNKHIGVSR